MDPGTLRKIARQNQRDKAREDASYDALVTAIWEAHDGGMKQTEIVQAVELTRERVRIVCSDSYRENRTARRSGT
jgi:hypothetical protein